MRSYRFFSDTDEANFAEAASLMGAHLVWQGHVAEVPDELYDAAIENNGAEVQDEPTSSGADGFLDTGAFSVRSDAAKMPFYSPPSVTTVFYKKTERRKTRSQP